MRAAAICIIMNIAAARLSGEKSIKTTIIVSFYTHISQISKKYMGFPRQGNSINCID